MPQAPIHLVLRPVTAGDLDFLLTLRRQTMGPHVRTAGLPDDDEAHLARIHYHYEDARLILIDGQPAGLFKAYREPTHWYVVQIQVAPAWQGQGVGGRVLGMLLQEADRDGLPVQLTVLHANPARKLYERAGFRIVSKGETEYLMQRDPR